MSWYQGAPKRSLQMIAATGVAPHAAVIDVGGGASTLVDNLLDAGFDDVTVLEKAVEPGGHVILATFGPNGPERCSGLPVQCYSTDQMADVLGPRFELRADDLEEHSTPTGSVQQFLYAWWQAKI